MLDGIFESGTFELVTHPLEFYQLKKSGAIFKGGVPQRLGILKAQCAS